MAYRAPQNASHQGIGMVKVGSVACASSYFFYAIN